MPSPSAIRTAAARKRFVRGALGSYEVPTVQACDIRLQILAGLSKVPGTAPKTLDSIRRDVDALLDHRLNLAGKS